MRTRSVAVVLGLALAASASVTAARGAIEQAAATLPAGPAYVHAVETWRTAHETALKAPDGALSMSGLYWLSDGDNTVGTDPSNKIVLPAGSAPARLGTFTLDNGKVFFTADAGATVRVNKQPARPRQELSSGERPDQVTVQSLTMSIVHGSDFERSDRFAVSVRDPNSSMRRDFKGLSWWPVQDTFRVTATFVPYAPPKPLAVVDVLGDMSDETAPGYLEFTLGGRKLRLDTSWETPSGGRLFIAFRDRTNTAGSYDAGRYVEVDFPGGRAAADALLKKAASGTSERVPVELDFNRAYNPPCAVTPYTACPLPPKQNWLTVAIEAGERYTGQH